MNKTLTTVGYVADAERRYPVLNVPVAGGNPYQRLLYSDRDGRFDFVKGSKDGFQSLASDAASGGPRFLHIHWDDRIFGRSKDVEENRAFAVRAFEDLWAFKEAGGRILWTVHNRLPHKQIDLETFQETRRALCKTVDLIHVHAPHAAEYVLENCGAEPKKIRIVPHPSYLGAYETAEATLNRAMPIHDARMFLFFGMFRGDKGVSGLQGVARKLTARGHQYGLRMYGKAFSSQRRLLRRLGWNPNIELRTDRIPDDEIHSIFGEAQVFVAPFDGMFTSGTVMLAQTFGLPVVGPDIPQMRQSVPERCYDMLYPADSPRGLIRKMVEVIQMNDADLQQRRAACFEFALQHSPHNISRKITAAFNELLNKEVD